MDIENIIANSYKNFHARGLDYICLRRSQKHTQKVYFFDGDASKLPDVVNPHDHRYHFNTTVITGVMSNSEYLESANGKIHQEFEWRTPLNGGNGFTWKGEVRLLETQRRSYNQYERYAMSAKQFHTIRVLSDQAIIVLDQFEDVVPLDKPTRTFMQDKSAPSLDGLYERFTTDEILSRIQILRQFKWPCYPSLPASTPVDAVAA
jgi:hypothetical protein